MSNVEQMKKVIATTPWLWKSARDFLGLSYDRISDPYEDSLDKDDESRGFLNLAVMVEAAHSLGDNSQVFSNGFQWCESPIEQTFLSALHIYARLHSRISTFRISREDLSDEPTGEWVSELRVQPQKQFGKWRVDFLITFIGSTLDRSDPKTGVLKTKTYKNQVIVECDGHDFHDRTKKQVSRDKGRDRELQALGFAVFRFPGTDLWNDPMKCAEEVINFVTSSTDRSKVAP